MGRTSGWVMMVIALSVMGIASNHAFGSDTGLGLMEAVRLAKENDPTVRGAYHELQAIQTLPDQALSGLLPTVQGSLSLTNISFVQAPPTYQGYWSESEGISLRQPLFNVGAHVGYVQSQKRVEAGRARYDETVRNLLYRVASAYLNAVYAEEHLRVVRDEEKTAAEQVLMARRYFQSGEASLTDVHDAEARQADIRYQRVDAEKLVTLSRNTLEALIGRPSGSLFRLGPRWKPSPPDPTSVEAWLNTARTHSPFLKYYRLGVEVAEDDILKARSLHLPTLDFQGSYARRNTISDYIRSQATEWYALGVQLTVPVFSGGYATAKTREAVERRNQSEEDYRRAETDVTQKILDAFYGLEASRAKIESSNQAVRANETAVASTRKAFEAGLRSIVDVLNAQSRLYKAKADLVRARHEYVLNLVALHFHAGILDESLLTTIDEWLERNMP
ncbi:TolC family outer membrane protein [Desulfosoma caldarium]|uniref:Outer membrane protein/protease secretion system outer membrane protein n=1 Tax=Desulfosoma caldarium TaxID=610254 RepID=A0A3N1VMB0_9BACT|nr:TolC family outer membrane protein [Desulfosoma caldarium]ROR03199.1 outer membrane protein/protease secretion system outer membrane protein [Desulfosoma caldarium]